MEDVLEENHLYMVVYRWETLVYNKVNGGFDTGHVLTVHSLGITGNMLSGFRMIVSTRANNTQIAWQKTQIAFYVWLGLAGWCAFCL